MKEHRLANLLSVLRSVVFGEKSFDFSTINNDELTEICKLAKKHDVLHLFSFGIISKNLVLDDNPLYKILKKEQMLALFRSENVSFLIDKTREKLLAAGIEFILLKGGVVRSLYPEPWMRTSCDVDVLVRKQDAERAVEYLCEHGFKKGKDFTTHDYILVAENGLILELHYSLNQDGVLPKSDAILDEVWEHVQIDTNKTCEKRMTNEFFVFYHLVHMAKHFINGGCGIRPFIDLNLINEKMTYDRAALECLLVRAGLKEFYENANALCKVWFEGMAHTNTTKAASDYLIFGGVYGNLNNSAKVQAARGKSRKKTLINLMFLPKANLEIIYPNLKKRPWLLPFYQVKRWFRVFKRDNRKRAEDIIKARNAVSEEELTATEKLLIDLGLK